MIATMVSDSFYLQIKTKDLERANMNKAMWIIAVGVLLFLSVPSSMYALDKVIEDTIKTYYNKGFERKEIGMLLEINPDPIQNVLKNSTPNVINRHQERRTNLIALIIAYAEKRTLDEILEDMSLNNNIARLIAPTEVKIETLHQVLLEIIKKENIRTLIFLISEFKEGKSYKSIVKDNANIFRNLIATAFSFYQRLYPSENFNEQKSCNFFK